MIIDGSGLIMGRLASFAAKQVLENEPVVIVNCNEVIINGKQEITWKKYKDKDRLGSSRWGPFLTKTPAALMRRSVKGMLPRKRARGQEAYHGIICHNGMPEDIKPEQLASVKLLKKSHSARFTTLAKICEKIGGYRK